MRNPKWHRDEIILALDLYFKIDPGKIHAGNPQIIELSRLLNFLPHYGARPDEERFRNPNGVGLKLSNFLAIDDNYNGKGMSSYSKLDKEVFDEYKNDKLRLSEIADAIKSTITNPQLRSSIAQIENDQEEGGKEGQVLYRLHKYRERNQKIVVKKKLESLKKFGKLECEICGFDFFVKYGELGQGFIECHHRVPLADLASVSETKLADLALVCANCHRMLHTKPFLNISSLISELKS